MIDEDDKTYKIDEDKIDKIYDDDEIDKDEIDERDNEEKAHVYVYVCHIFHRRVIINKTKRHMRSRMC